MESTKPIENKRYISIRTRFSAITAAVGIIVAIIIAIAVTLQARAQLFSEFQQRALNLANLAALQQNGNIHSEITSPNDISSVSYSFIQKVNTEILGVDKTIGSVYTMRQNENGDIYFVVDVVSAEVAQVRGPAEIGEIYNDVSPALGDHFATMETGVVEEGFYTDEWGTWLSAYAPFYKTDGSREGVVGVDISASAVQNAQNLLVLTSGLFLVILIPIVAGTGWYVGGRITSPIISLRDGVIRIAGGERNLRVDISTNDELEQLADSVNDLSRQIDYSIHELETRVEERTAELHAKTRDIEMATTVLEKRANQLRTISEIARDISLVREIKKLLPAVTHTISERFGYYHIGIFLNDANNQYTYLQAANSEGGKRMLERQHRLKIGEVGIVGNVARTGQARVALDIGADSTYFSNPDLPDTHSELALPLKSSGSIMGVLDVQSTEQNAFNQEDVDTLGVMADLVGIAIQNANLFASAERATTDANAILRQYARTDWQRVRRERAVKGFFYSMNRSEYLENTVIFSNQEGITTQSVMIPVRVRDEIVGEMGIRQSQDRPLNQDELEIAQAIAERVGLAIENARLIEETQKRVIKERAISDIASKIGASVTLDNVLITAVEELGTVLPGSEIFIQFGDEDTGTKSE